MCVGDGLGLCVGVSVEVWEGVGYGFRCVGGSW